MKVRGARFNPGSSRRFDGSTHKDAQESPLVDSYIQTVLSTLHGQLEYQIPDKFLLRMAVRGNAYAYGVGGVGGQSGWLFHPEGSLTARVHLLSSYLTSVLTDTNAPRLRLAYAFRLHLPRTFYLPPLRQQVTTLFRTG